MNYFPVDPEILKQLYENGHISSEALTAIAPIQWLAVNYPELLSNTEEAMKAIAPKPQTCDRCVNFSSVHSCCMTRLDSDSTYLEVGPESPSCIDFQAVQLPYFLGKGGML